MLSSHPADFANDIGFSSGGVQVGVGFALEGGGRLAIFMKSVGRVEGWAVKSGRHSKVVVGTGAFGSGRLAGSSKFKNPRLTMQI